MHVVCLQDERHQVLTTNVFIDQVRHGISLYSVLSLLAHLSRRLMGELIVYVGIWRPSGVRRRPS